MFGDGANGAAAFMLLLLLDDFHRHVLPFVPVDLTPAETGEETGMEAHFE